MNYLDRVWDYRFPNEKDRFKSQKQKDKYIGLWKRNATMLKKHKEGSSALKLSKEYGLSLHWTKVVLAREDKLQNCLSNLPKEKVTVSDLGPFRFRTGRCLRNENLLHLPIEEFYRSQNARSLLGIPNFGVKSLREIALCLEEEGYDISKFTLP
jgi:DNA-directed RNA polymerase alpha subunit